MENNNGLRVDVVDFALKSKYIKNGLTTTSNNTVIHPRDGAGNITLNENSENNPLLIIETTSTKILQRSMLRVLDTNFEYFKFPVDVTPVASNFDLNVDLGLDPVFARYKPNENRSIQSPEESGGVYAGILMDELVDGLPQQNTNTYYITKDVKNTGADLRFRIKIQHSFSGPIEGTAFFSIIRNGPERDQIEREYRGPFSTTGTYNPFNQDILTRAPFIRQGINAYAALAIERLNFLPPSDAKTIRLQWFRDLLSLLPTPSQIKGEFRFNSLLISKWSDPRTQFTGLGSEYENVSQGVNSYTQLVTSAENYSVNGGTTGLIGAGETQTLNIDIVIPNSEFEIGDAFGIGARAGQTGHTIIAEQSYWVITDASKNVDLWNQPIQDVQQLTLNTQEIISRS